MSTAFNNNSVDYDKVSRIYDVSRAANVETIEKLIKVLHVANDSWLIDMGCGTGNYAAAIQQVAERVIGIDISVGMLKRARAKFPGIQFVQGDITCLPFSSNTFDGALAIQVLHHIKEKELFIREAYRVLRKGACFAIDSCSHQQMHTFWLYYYFPRGLDLDLARITDCDEIASLLGKAGFSNVSIEISYTDIAIEHEKPERYLDKDYRNGQSTFCLVSEKNIELGCRKLREDIASGAVTNVIGQFETKERKAGGSCIIYGRKRSG
jgi:SAM-dependent methyltransferase